MLGWAAGFITGTTLVYLDGMKPLHYARAFGDTKVTLLCRDHRPRREHVIVAIIANVLVPVGKLQPAE